MNKPRNRNTKIDSTRKRVWSESFSGYRVAVTNDRIDQWLLQFRKGDKDVAARVLDTVNFVTTEDMENVLRDLVQALPGWNSNDHDRRGEWRFLAFTQSAGESGDAAIARCRTALGLTSNKYNSMFIYKSQLSSKEFGPEDNLVFCDDFAGTGRQVLDAWNKEIAELVLGNPKVYLLLVVAGNEALERIQSETNIKVHCGAALDLSDNIFSPACRHFSTREKETILGYCKKASRKNPKGWYSCGFVVVTAHKTPNNSIPILHANHKKWRGLFPRST